MGVGLTIFISFLFLVFLGLIGVLAYNLIREEEEKENRPHFINLTRQNEGRAYGKILGMEKNPEGRNIIVYQPQDLSFKTLKKIKKIEPIRAIIDKNKDVWIPKTKLSNDKEICVGLPNHADDFPEGFQETLFGKWLMVLTELKNFDNTELAAYKECVERQTEHIKKVAIGEVSRERIQHFEGLFLDAIKNAMEVKKLQTTSSYTPISTNIPK